MAITGSTDATVGNIDALLKNKKVNITTKNDWAFDKEKPLVVDSNKNNEQNFIYRSVITGYKRDIGFSSGVRRNRQNEVIGVYMLNKSLSDLIINEAYPEITKGFEKSRILIDVKSPELFNTDLDTLYAYCYDLIIPPTKWESLDIKNYLKEDLKRVFKISVRKESKTLKSIIVSATYKLTTLTTKYNKKEIDLGKSSIKKYFHNYSIPNILRILSGCFKLPLIDETGLKKHIDIDFPDGFDFSNTKSLTEILESIGFSIKEEEREMDVVIITDK